MPRSSRIEPMPLTESVLREFAEIAKIKVSAHDLFRRDLQFIFSTALDWHSFDLTFDLNAPRRQDIVKQLAKVEKAAAKLMAQLDGLDGSAQKALGVAALRYREFGSAKALDEYIFQMNDIKRIADGVAVGERLLSDCRHAVAMIHAGASSYEFKAGPKGGVPTKSPMVPGNPRSTAEDYFIMAVFKSVRRHGGHLTSDKNVRGGTWIKFLDLAANHLPSTFDLKGFSISRLQYLSRLATGQEPAQK